MARRTYGLRRLLAAFAGFRRDERGAISIIAVGTIFLVLAVAAVVIDAGSILYARRSLQTVTDAAALSAAQHLDVTAATQTSSSTAIDTVLSENGYAATNLVSATPGVYSPDETKAASERFQENAPNPNAIKVRTSAKASTYFARALGWSNAVTVTAESTAMRKAIATFQAGTRLAQLQDGIANALLGGLLGTTVSLSAVDYNGLLGANISALSFLDALATQVGLSSTSTYGDLLNTNATVGEILNAGLNVLQDSSGTLASGSVSSAISALKLLLNQLPLNGSVKISQLVSAPDIIDRTVGALGGGGDSPEINVYGLVAATARARGAGKVINLGTTLTVPITGTTIKLKLAVGEGIQSATGGVGTSISTAQVRLAADVQLVNTSATLLLSTITATNIDLPLYIEAAPGTATIKAIPCTSPEMVTLTGTSGAVSLKYGTVADSALADFTSSPTVTPASIANVTLLGLPIARIDAAGSTNVASHGPEDHTFSDSDVQSGAIQTVPAGNDGRLIAENAPGALHTSVTLLGTVSLGLLDLLLSGITSTLVSVLSILDAPINSLLTTLGLGLGTMDMSVTGVKCGVPVLVG